MELATAPLMQQAENERSEGKERCTKALRTTTVTWRLEDITETRAKSKQNRFLCASFDLEFASASCFQDVLADRMSF